MNFKAFKVVVRNKKPTTGKHYGRMHNKIQTLGLRDNQHTHSGPVLNIAKSKGM
jgi:hypothetical protein